MQMFRGDRLKKLRIKKGLTQQELGDIVGVTKSAVCFYEKDKRNPSLENIIDFMHIFAVSADYLLGAEAQIKTVTDEEYYEVTTMSKEEVIFIEELKKNKDIYEILFDNPKRGAELVKNKLS